MEQTRLGFIGTGNMAGAIIGGVVGRGLAPASEIGVYDIDAQKLERYRAAGHKVYDSARELASGSKNIILSVKPQNFGEVLPEIRKGMTPEKVIISIAAGITAERIKEAVGFDCKVVLVMPNTPLLLGAGASALARIGPATEEEFEEIRLIFASGGIAEEVCADKMREIIPVNASSPAFIYRFAQIIGEKAAERGISKEAALRLFGQTLIGSAKMLMESGKSPGELIDMVCSPGGATLAAMRALEDNGFEKAVEAAFDACVQRAEELSGG